jgi:hypothetical protein
MQGLVAGRGDRELGAAEAATALVERDGMVGV